MHAVHGDGVSFGVSLQAYRGISIALALRLVAYGVTPWSKPLDHTTVTTPHVTTPTPPVTTHVSILSLSVSLHMYCPW